MLEYRILPRLTPARTKGAHLCAERTNLIYQGNPKPGAPYIALFAMCGLCAKRILELETPYTMCKNSPQFLPHTDE